MSYEVLARKYRPLTFDEVVGQDHITRTLKRAVQTERISHAYLFAGPRGCGKTSTARILARVINCDALRDGNPCNECPSCAGVIGGSNLDVMEIDGASHTGVAEVRDLQESIGYAPSQYRNKVYVIDEVHMLSTHAFNALLKTLEEPPAHVYFIFATTAPQKIPDTIKSRCQRHHFKRIEIREIAGHLESICKSEGVEFESDGLRLLARKADGSMRDGASLLDQCVTSSSGHVTTEAVREILGLVDIDKVFAFMDAIAGDDASVALRLLDECVNEGLDLQELAGALLEGYRDLMLLSTPGDLRDLVFRSADEIELLARFRDHYELPDVVTVVERLCNSAPRLKAAADPRVLLESLLVDLTLLDRQTDIRDLVSRLENADASGVRHPDAGESRRRRRQEVNEERAAAGAASIGTLPPHPVPSTSAAPLGAVTAAEVRGTTSDGQLGRGNDPVVSRMNSATQNPPDSASRRVAGGLDLAKLQELWDGFVAFVRQKKVALGVCLISGKVHGFDGSRLVLRFGRNFNLQREQVENPRNVEFLKTMFGKYFGVDVELVCFSEGDAQTFAFNERARNQKTPGERLGVSEGKKPVIKRIMEEFDGEIVRFSR